MPNATKLAETLNKQYQLRFAEMAKYRNRVWKVLCSEFFSRYIPEKSRVLDVGAGWGEFINNIVASDKFAMDLNSSSSEHLMPGVTCIQQDCSERWPFEPDYLDVVFISNFLEHLPDKASIERTAAEAYRCLKNDGLIICISPNIKFVPGAFWDFWDHTIPLTELSCAEMLRMNGFAIEQCIPRFLPYSMSTGSKPPLFMVKMYIRFPMLWPVFGKQFLIVGRKNQASTVGK